MGNSTSSSKTPHNKTGSKVVSQKLVNAAKLGVLSLTEVSPSVSETEGAKRPRIPMSTECVCV